MERREPGRQLSATAIALLAITACGTSSPTPSAPPVGRLVAAALVAADATTTPWRCAAADLPTLADGPLVEHWQLAGHTLRHARADAELVIGVIADAAGSSPRTIATLGRLRAALDAARPDLVLSLGGMGATQAELEATLGTLADRAPWPVVALPGDLESMTAHVAAIASLRKRGDAIVDGRLVRWIEHPGATIGTLPGAGAIERLAAGGDGCAWRVEDVARVYSELTTRPGIRILASAEAPRHVIGGEPTGELALAPSRTLPVDLALHGPVQVEASRARSGARDGAGHLLSPGTADATPRLPHAHHRPCAGVLVIRGQTWQWRPIVDAS